MAKRPRNPLQNRGRPEKAASDKGPVVHMYPGPPALTFAFAKRQRASRFSQQTTVIGVESPSGARPTPESIPAFGLLFARVTARGRR